MKLRDKHALQDLTILGAAGFVAVCIGSLGGYWPAVGCAIVLVTLWQLSAP